MRVTALVYYSIDSASGFAAVSDFCKFLSKTFEVVHFSSVFKRRHHDLGESSSEYCGVVRLVSGKKSSEEFTVAASLIISNYSNQRSLQQFVLLSHGAEVRFTPYGPLPHPLLLQDQLVLICAAEVAAEWIHPVTQSNLVDILAKQDMSTSAEFIAQGKTLGLEVS